MKRALLVLAAVVGGLGGAIAYDASRAHPAEAGGWASAAGGPFPSAMVNGTTTNDSAAAGKIGEYMVATVDRGSGVALSGGTAKTVTSISLTAGDWDVTGCVGFQGTPTGGTYTVATINTTTDTDPGQGAADSKYRAGSPTMPNGNADYVNCVPNYRVSLSATTTYYLIARSGFTGGTQSAYGRISARRVR